MMEKHGDTIGFAKGKQTPHGFLKNPLGPPSLSDAGIDKNLAHRARQLASLGEKQFDSLITETRDIVSRGAEKAAMCAATGSSCIRARLATSGASV
jgi:hypothetical protein